MGHKLAFDFGTTNSLVAHWDDHQADLVHLDELSLPADPIVPSLVYMGAALHDAPMGAQVIAAGLHQQADHRLFRNFKRGIVVRPAPAPRYLDNQLWSDKAIGSAFIQRVLASVPFPKDAIDEIVLTVPVIAFQDYLDWLRQAVQEGVNGLPIEKIRVVDESTAAALGYAVTEPDALVLVFDFGGGTLDVSLVQLPKDKASTGGWLNRLRRGGDAPTAKMIAKSGGALGGSDVDRWLAHHILNELGLDEGSEGYQSLLTACENAKIALSNTESALLQFTLAGVVYERQLTRVDLEAVLHQNGFDAAVSRVIERTLYTARQQEIFAEHLKDVLMVGGMALMPSVQAILRRYLPNATLHTGKVFTAIVEGALQIAVGSGIDDTLVHSYGLRHLENGQHRYDEILPAGLKIPTTHPVELILGAAHEQQTGIELVIGEIDPEQSAGVTINLQGGELVAMAEDLAVAPLNHDQPTQIPLDPVGKLGAERIKAAFSVDADRQLLVTVTDMERRKTLLKDHRLGLVR
ncbi:MAG: Hsp70 family protein [Chloroflexi bacterium]|nr:Hsp70 family protein [Chloroflexota bacterium]